MKLQRSYVGGTAARKLEVGSVDRNDSLSGYDHQVCG